MSTSASRLRAALVTISAAAVLGLAAASPALAAAPSQIMSRPVAVFSTDASGRPQYEVYVRLDRPVPRNRARSLLGNLRLAGFGATEAPSEFSNGFFTMRSSKGRYCYGQSFAVFPGPLPSRLRNPRVGRLVPVEALIRGVAKPLKRWTRLRARGGRAFDDPRYGRELGCLRRR